MPYQNPLGQEASLIELLRHAPDRVDLDTFEAIIDELEELKNIRAELENLGFSSVIELSDARFDAVSKLTMYRDALEDLREKDKDD